MEEAERAGEGGEAEKEAPRPGRERHARYAASWISLSLSPSCGRVVTDRFLFALLNVPSALPRTPLLFLRPHAVDPNEPVYCYCNRVSFGEVSPDDGLELSLVPLQLIGTDAFLLWFTWRITHR